MKNIIAIVCIVLSMGFTSFASSWYWVGQDTVGSQWYIDNASVYIHNLTTQEIRSNAYSYKHGYSFRYYPYKIIWVKINRTDGTYGMERLKISRNRKMTVLSWVMYANNGNIIAHDTNPFPKATDIPPDSVGEKIYHLVW